MPCPVCGNLCSCTCELNKIHKKECRFRRAATISVEIPCDHGFQACPICDPCECEGVPKPTEGIR